jgi:hypothetical protein
MSETLDRCDMLLGRKNRLTEKFKDLRDIIQNLIPTIGIDDIGIYNGGSNATLPRIKPEIVDHAMQLEERARELLSVQDELTDTNRDLTKARETHYAETGQLI